MDAGGKLAARLCDRRDDFGFAIVDFSYICGGVPLSPANGVYISWLVRYARACYTCDQFLSRSELLTDGLVLQGFLQSCLVSAFCGFCGRCGGLIHNYKLSLGHMLSGIFHTNG
jgi:hypothetical protein